MTTNNTVETATLADLDVMNSITLIPTEVNGAVTAAFLAGLGKAKSTYGKRNRVTKTYDGVMNATLGAIAKRTNDTNKENGIISDITPYDVAVSIFNPVYENIGWNANEKHIFETRLRGVLRTDGIKGFVDGKSLERCFAIGLAEFANNPANDNKVSKSELAKFVHGINVPAETPNTPEETSASNKK